MTRAATAEQIADHAHDLRKHEPSPRHQKRAVIELVGYLHGLMYGGLLFGPEVEKQLRARIRNVCTEFDMDPPAERADTRILAAFDGVVPR